MRTLPRTIAPELVELGDLVSVEHSTARGVTHYKRGRVHERIDQGDVRQYRTREGGILFTWQPGKPKVKVTLIERQAASEPALFEMDIERLAG